MYLEWSFWCFIMYALVYLQHWEIPKLHCIFYWDHPPAILSLTWYLWLSFTGVLQVLHGLLLSHRESQQCLHWSLCFPDSDLLQEKKSSHFLTEDILPRFLQLQYQVFYSRASWVSEIYLYRILSIAMARQLLPDIQVLLSWTLLLLIFLWHWDHVFQVILPRILALAKQKEYRWDFGQVWNSQRWQLYHLLFCM